MKKTLFFTATIILSTFIGNYMQAAETPSAALGEKMFNDSTLGGTNNGKSCNSCHPGGKGLEAAGSNPNLAVIINRCITGPLGGQAIRDNSIEMQAITLYIKSLKEKKR
jgi:cytochrome c peroxidase